MSVITLRCRYCGMDTTDPEHRAWACEAKAREVLSPEAFDAATEDRPRDREWLHGLLRELVAEGRISVNDVRAILNMTRR